MAQTPDRDSMLALAAKIHDEVYHLNEHLGKSSVSQPRLAVGAATELWSSHSSDIGSSRGAILSWTKQLTKLLVGPHEFWHEYVSSNWEHGALYTLLEFEIFEKIPLDDNASVSLLASQSGLPQGKLLAILRLITCEGILNEVSECVFGHTAISETLVKDEKFKSWVGFQLFETRVASAHLADSMKADASGYQVGQSAFKYAWGSSMYDWHKKHQEKATRFQMAMEGVTQSLDPGSKLYYDWFEKHQSRDRLTVVDVEGRNVSILANQFTEMSFRSQVDRFEPEPIAYPKNTLLVYLVRNILWNHSDAECIKILRAFVPAMRKTPGAVLLVNEMLSPAPGIFERNAEKSYRRRDVTVLTMHNAKQRTEDEWRALFVEASPDFELTIRTAATSHSYRGLWEVRLRLGANKTVEEALNLSFT